MRILGHLERYGPPVGGGVVTTVTVLRELAKRGCEVRIVTDRDATIAVPHIDMLASPSERELREAYQRADLVVPHMTSTPAVIDYARLLQKPVMYPVHDDGQLQLYGIKPGDVSLVLFFSYGLQDRTQWSGDQFVVHPPTFVHEHRVESTGEAITISSLSPEKGGELFWELAHRLPDRKLIGVIGGWGEQIIPERIPDNVEIIGHQGDDLRNIFRRTRIVLVPSQRLGEGVSYWTENWGRVAIEAAASGIPVIANPAPGPLESLGDSGIFRDRADVNGWIEAITRLDDPAIYACQSSRVRQRAEELDRIVTEQLDQLAQRLPSVVQSYRTRDLASLD